MDTPILIKAIRTHTRDFADSLARNPDVTDANVLEFTNHIEKTTIPLLESGAISPEEMLALVYVTNLSNAMLDNWETQLRLRQERKGGSGGR